MGNNYLHSFGGTFTIVGFSLLLLFNIVNSSLFTLKLKYSFLLLVQMLFEIHLKHPILTNSVVWLSYILKVNVFYLQAYQPRILNPASFSALAKV